MLDATVARAVAVVGHPFVAGVAPELVLIEHLIVEMLVVLSPIGVSAFFAEAVAVYR